MSLTSHLSGVALSLHHPPRPMAATSDPYSKCTSTLPVWTQASLAATLASAGPCRRQERPWATRPRDLALDLGKEREHSKDEIAGPTRVAGNLCAKLHSKSDPTPAYGPTLTNHSEWNVPPISISRVAPSGKTARTSS